MRIPDEKLAEFKAKIADLREEEKSEIARLKEEFQRAEFSIEYLYLCRRADLNKEYFKRETE